MSETPWIRYANSGGIRSDELSPELVQALSYLQNMGLYAQVVSGGQMGLQDAINQGAVKKGSKWYLDGVPVRTGSVRHDHGNAADVDFYWSDGTKLDWNNPSDVYYFDQIVRKGKEAGLTGFGAGVGSAYMGPGRMHVGYGTNSVWGANGSSDNAPAWLRRAYYGEPYQGVTPAAREAGVVPPEEKKDDEVPPEQTRAAGVPPPQVGVGPYGITAAPDVAVASAPVNNEFFSTMNLPDDTPYRSPEVGAGVRPPDPLTTQRPNLGGPRGFGNVDPDGAWGPVYDLFRWQRPSQREEAVQQPQGNGGFSQPPSAYYTPQQLPNGQMLLNPGQFDVGENDTWNAPPPPTQQWVEVPSYHGFIEAPPPPQ